MSSRRGKGIAVEFYEPTRESGFPVTKLPGNGGAECRLSFAGGRTTESRVRRPHERELDEPSRRSRVRAARARGRALPSAGPRRGGSRVRQDRRLAEARRGDRCAAHQRRGRAPPPSSRLDRDDAAHPAAPLLEGIVAETEGDVVLLDNIEVLFDVTLRQDVRLLVHWCMCMAVYPFFGTVADAVGRLLRLQGTASAAQVQRRLRERYGERETVARAARRILRAYIDWGVLQETEEKGLYRGASTHVVDKHNTRALGHHGHTLRHRQRPSIGVRSALQPKRLPLPGADTVDQRTGNLQSHRDLPPRTGPGSPARSLKKHCAFQESAVSFQNFRPTPSSEYT